MSTDKEIENFDDNLDDDDMRLPETDNKRWELDEEPIIQNLRYELSKRMNALGVDSVLSWLRVHLGKNIALSNLDQSEINEFMRDELPVFNLELVQNERKWNIKSSSARAAVSRWVELAMYAQLKRAFNDGERKYRKDSYSYNEHYRHDEVDNSEIGSGFKFPKLFGGRKKQRQPREERYEDF